MRIKHSFAYAAIVVLTLLSAVSCNLPARESSVKIQSQPTPAITAQPVTLPASEANTTQIKSEKNTNRIEDFAPQSWYLLAKAEGDLDNDNRADAVAVFSKSNPELRKDDENQNEEALEAPRLLLIALRSEDAQLHEAGRSHQFVLSRRHAGMLDEPLIQLEINNGVVVVNQESLGTSAYDYTNTIRYENGRWIVKGEVEVRDRRQGKTRKLKQKKTVMLSEFDIENAFPIN